MRMRMRMRNTVGRYVGSVATVTLFAVLLTTPAGPVGAAPSDVPTPVLEEIALDAGLHGHPLWDSWFDLAPFGYEQHEYLVSGTATATGSDETADYTTRIIVTHPSDPADFSGTVMLDWVNVTAQFENAVNTLQSIRFLLREGWAYVHVSAQSAGLCCIPLTPQVWDPLRYADLSHPGDQFANDMFSQVAQAFRRPGDVHPLNGMDAEVIIAAGQSQGGNRLSDYIVTTAADDGVIDAVLQQAGGTKTYEVAPSLPVIHMLGDREGTPEPPTPWPTYRLWEVAASAHADGWVGRQQTEGQAVRLVTGSPRSQADAEALWASASNYGEQPDPREAICVVNGALFPTRYAGNAALAALDRWVRTGASAPTAPRYEFAGDSLATDEHGNTLGGLRLPPVDVPVARYEADICNLGGITIPFTEPELLVEYGDHATYYAAMVAATEASVAAGHLLVPDAEELLARACAARNRFLDTGTGPCEPAADFARASDDPDPEPGAEPGSDPGSDTGDGSSMPATGGGAALAVIAALSAAGRRRR